MRRVLFVYARVSDALDSCSARPNVSDPPSAATMTARSTNQTFVVLSALIVAIIVVVPLACHILCLPLSTPDTISVPLNNPTNYDSMSNANSASSANAVLGIMNSAKEKWDSSGASEAMGRIGASIPQSTKDYTSQLFSRQQLRSLTVVLGIGEERPFFVEKSPALLMARIKHNLTFFYLNYLVLTAVLFCLTVLISPMTIIGIGLLGVAWMYIIRQSQSGQLKIGGLTVTQNQASLVMGGISVLVLLWLLKGVFWYTIFSSGFLVAVHALLRDASMHQDSEDTMDMVGEVGEDAAFLNNNNNVV